MQIEKKNFREPLINAAGLPVGNSLAYNWAKQSEQSGKWEKSAKAVEFQTFRPRPTNFPGPAYYSLPSDVPWVQKGCQGEAEPGGLIMSQDQKGAVLEGK